MNFRLKGASGALTGKHFDIGDSLTIGSADQADIRHPGLQPRHAIIRVEDGGLILEAEGAVEINGEQTTRQGLESGDEIRVDTLRFVLQAPGLKPVRVLEEVSGESRSGRVWAVAGGLAIAVAAAAAWWFLLGPGSVA